MTSRASAVLAIDLGTTGVKVAVIDDSGSVLAGAGEVLPLIFTDDGGVEQDAHGWWAAIGRCGRRAVAASGLQPADIGTVAVTSQYTSTVAVDAAGLPLANTVMWMDGRGRRHHRSVATAANRARWIELHGMAPSGNDDIGHVAVIRDLWPEVYAAAAAFLEPMDAIAARLTGHVTATQNTMFPMLSVDNRTWGSTEYSDELLAMSALDIDKLPRLVPMGQPRGTITSAAAEHLGISPLAVVADATIDSVTSAIGTGATDSSRCGLIIGTTTVMATHLPDKRHDLAHGLTSAPSPLSGSYFLVAENGVGGKALDVLVNNIIYPDDGLGEPAPPDAFERVLSVAATAPRGANGVMFLPWLIGSLAPSYHARTRAAFVNLGLGSNRADMARAVVEGVALNAAWLLPHFSALAGATYDEVGFGGGGAGSPLWGQCLADCFGIPVRRLADSSSTNARGAALVAMIADGRITLDESRAMLPSAEVHDPDPAAHAVYQRLLPQFIDFHDRAAPFYDALNS
ncbi:MAG TPA: FGGY family carbohydrate kinase [Ilumatobacteraceae bacterium]|nr:FGGY family carbohydrate kinase [Ilumatobacteraceae bacterium]HRB02791.1 FGGY family carbohydrate kinase [Ilumatobacteraceae bacterium]